MSSIKVAVYQIFAPLARMVLKNRITTKPIRGGDGLVLHYPAGQHLGFLGQREIAYEYELQQMVLREIEKGQYILEIGSNIGQYSLLMAQKTGSEGKVVCVEPDSVNFSFLTDNVQANNLDNVTLVHMAVGNKAGIVNFYKDSVTGGRMSSLVKKYTSDHYLGKSEEVEVITLPTLLDLYGTPDFLKVDTEGAEVMIFSSLTALPRTTTYFVEVRSETAKAIFSQFSNQGFSIYSLDQQMKQIHDERDLIGFDNWLIKFEKVDKTT